jgi:hypothetical protein
MPQITIKGKNPDGTPWAQQIEAHRFAHYIGNVRYWFAYHCPIDRIGGLQVTHIAMWTTQPARLVLTTIRARQNWPLII